MEEQQQTYLETSSGQLATRMKSKKSLKADRTQKKGKKGEQRMSRIS